MNKKETRVQKQDEEPNNDRVLGLESGSRVGNRLGRMYRSEEVGALIFTGEDGGRSLTGDHDT